LVTTSQATRAIPSPANSTRLICYKITATVAATPRPTSKPSTKRSNAFTKTRPSYSSCSKDPTSPLHNNFSERDIREYVIKRKISGSTRSEDGRRARDTFASLKNTCPKLGIGFWDYLLDRLTLSNTIPPLSQLVTKAAFRSP
jgi:hypothetical protein